MLNITIVTYAGLPNGAPDDLLLARALEAQGADVRFAVWDDPEIDWAASELSIVRSAWDYHLKAASWYTWLERVQRLTTLINPPKLLSWNSDKSYLFELEATGVPIVPTLLFHADDAAMVEARIASHGWREVVIKPAIGASATGAYRFTTQEIANEGMRHLRRLLGQGSALIQPYQSEVETTLERSIVFIGGAFSHAFTKPPFHAGLDGNGRALHSHDPAPGEIELARAALESLSPDPVFARVDILPTSAGLVLMELELVEPQLALGLRDEAAAHLAAAIVKRRRETLSYGRVVDASRDRLLG